MSSEPWQTFGNVVNTAGLTGFAITGATTVLAGYKSYASPCASLAESKSMLETVKSRLQELSPQRREEIDAQCRASSCKSLKDLEGRLDFLMNAYYRLSSGSDKMTLVERHIPFSEFRQRVRKLDRDTKGLFKDTLSTTVPHLEDMGFDPQNLRLAMDRPSSSIDHPASSTVVDAIPMTRIV